MSFLLGKLFLFFVRRSRSRTRSEDRVPSPTYSTEDGLTSSHFQLRVGRLFYCWWKISIQLTSQDGQQKLSVMVIKCHHDFCKGKPLYVYYVPPNHPTYRCRTAGFPGLVATFATPGNLERLRHGCGENPAHSQGVVKIERSPKTVCMST